MSEALSTLKMLLKKENNDEDILLNFLIDDAENMIFGYCRINEMPQRLKTLVPKLAYDLYYLKGYDKAELPKLVQSVTQGNRSVNYDNQNLSEKDLLKNYYDRLKPFVNKKGKVPSNVTRCV